MTEDQTKTIQHSILCTEYVSTNFYVQPPPILKIRARGV